MEYSQGKYSFKLGYNQFMDLTNKEFKQKYTINLKEQEQQQRTQVIFKTKQENIDRIDWRQLGAVTQVKNQQSCGSCWAFSAVGALEGLNKIKNGVLEQFSEQQLVDCNSKNRGCHGGLSQNAFSYVRDNGITLENEYNYTGKDENCQLFQSKFKISGYVNVPEQIEEQLILSLQQQPVSIYIDAGTSKFQLYSSGIFDYKDCGDDLDHVVLAVGYDQQSITIKNSWGTSWGEQGYIRIKRVGDGTGICGILMDPNYPILN